MSPELPENQDMTKGENQRQLSEHFIVRAFQRGINALVTLHGEQQDINLVLSKNAAVDGQLVRDKKTDTQ